MNLKIMLSDSINTVISIVSTEFYPFSSNTVRSQYNFWTSEKFACKALRCTMEADLGLRKYLTPAVPVSGEVEFRKP
jgi:hypothetical protein